MDQAQNSWSPRHASALAYTWGQYRTWAATARSKRAHIFSWRFYTLVLIIIGALLATISQISTGIDWATNLPVSLSTAFGWLSGIAIALATFFGSEILRPEVQKQWVSSRSLAEALKSETYLFRSGTKPYNGPDAPQGLSTKIEELLASVQQIEAIPISESQKRERLPEGPLSIDHYITERIEDQIHNYYLPRVKEYQAITKRGRNISLVLGALAVILGILGATGWSTAWIALITTITAALAAHLFAGRYQYLIVSYQATARQLELLKNRWTIVASQPDMDSADPHQFILNCENVISIENSAWMSQQIEQR